MICFLLFTARVFVNNACIIIYNIIYGVVVTLHRIHDNGRPGMILYYMFYNRGLFSSTYYPSLPSSSEAAFVCRSINFEQTRSATV